MLLFPADQLRISKNMNLNNDTILKDSLRIEKRILVDLVYTLSHLQQFLETLKRSWHYRIKQLISQLDNVKIIES